MNKITSYSAEINWLVQIMDEDPVIQKTFSELLQLSSFERRSVLNIWLEQLRRRNASENLLYRLSILFDDIIAEWLLMLINNKSKKVK